MSCFNIQIRLDKANAVALETFFESQGALAITIEDAGDEPMFDLATPGKPQWQNQIVTALMQADHGESDLQILIDKVKSQFSLNDTQISVDEVEEQDWERSGLDNFKPIQVSDDFWVYPSWCEVENPKATNIMIDPGLAFGTGSHATTYLCLKQLAKLNLTQKTLLDFGCGSGILAIAALKRDADSAMAIDIDDKALTCTLENAQKNNVADRLSILPPPPYKGFELPQYDIVIANILAQALIDLKSTIVSSLKPEGMLMLSGILCQQEQMIKAAYSEFDLAVEAKGDWLVMFGNKRDV